MITDRDLIRDLPDPFDELAPRVLANITTWFVRQVNMIIRRKWIALLESKPGAVYGSTKIIFVKMFWHAYTAPEKSPLHAALKLRNKFNDALNDAVAKIDHYLLTVNSYNANEDYTHKGELSDKGKTVYWLEINGLMISYIALTQRRSSCCQTQKIPQSIHHLLQRTESITAIGVLLKWSMVTEGSCHLLHLTTDTKLLSC